MIEALFFSGLLLLTYFLGRHRDQAHERRLFSREVRYAHIPTSISVQDQGSGSECLLVNGTVVMASDYFKQFVASFRSLFGGRLHTHQLFIERARREALLRMKEKAHHWGAREIVGLELTICFIDEFGIEVSATGTAIK